MSIMLISGYYHNKYLNWNDGNDFIQGSGIKHIFKLFHWLIYALPGKDEKRWHDSYCIWGAKKGCHSQSVQETLPQQYRLTVRLGDPFQNKRWKECWRDCQHKWWVSLQKKKNHQIQKTDYERPKFPIFSHFPRVDTKSTFTQHRWWLNQTRKLHSNVNLYFTSVHVIFE